jgi:hypothetical protein
MTFGNTEVLANGRKVKVGDYNCNDDEGYVKDGKTE